ncbi:recombinase family protein, partial [Escherichia coli]
MSQIFAYCRISTLDQTTENQRREIESAGFKIKPQQIIEEHISGSALMNPLMILVKIIKLRWIHILSYDQMVSRKINNQTTRCANSIF